MARRKTPHTLCVLLTQLQYAQFKRIASERGITFRELVVTSVLGTVPTSVDRRIDAIEARVLNLEAKR